MKIKTNDDVSLKRLFPKLTINGVDTLDEFKLSGLKEIERNHFVKDLSLSHDVLTINFIDLVLYVDLVNGMVGVDDAKTLLLAYRREYMNIVKLDSRIAIILPERRMLECDSPHRDFKVLSMFLLETASPYDYMDSFDVFETDILCDTVEGNSLNEDIDLIKKSEFFDSMYFDNCNGMYSVTFNSKIE